MSTVAQGDLTVLLSSHLIADLDRLCDYIIILLASRVQVASDIEQLIERHKWITVPREETASIEQQHTVLQESHSEHMSKLLVCFKSNGPLNPRWFVQSVSLEDIILIYLAQPTSGMTMAGPGKTVQEV